MKKKEITMDDLYKDAVENREAWEHLLGVVNRMCEHSEEALEKLEKLK